MNKELDKAIEEMEYAVLACAMNYSKEAIERVGKAKEVIRRFADGNIDTEPARIARDERTTP